VSTKPKTIPDAERLVAELQFLTELSQVVASTSDIEPILEWVVHKTTAMFGTDEGCIKLLAHEVEGPATKTRIAKRDPGVSAGSWPAQVSMSVMGFLLQNNDHLATPDLPNDPRFSGLRGMETRVRAMLAVPLRVGNRVTGLLAVTHAAPGRAWSQDDVQLLSIVASSSAGVIEQARLRDEALRARQAQEENALMQRELKLAHDIQMTLVPSRTAHFGPWQVHGRVVPARSVGGDAFDYFALGPARFGVAIADVSGKGIPAALMASSMQASLRAYCDGRIMIREAMRQLNESISRLATAGQFVTMVYVEVDHERGRLFYSNAGHNYPLIRRRGGTLVELRDGGLPLGILEDRGYEVGEMPFEPGDALLLYSDGITDALNMRKEEFGEERLRGLWANPRSSAEDEVAAIMADVETFRGRAEPSDDMTVVVVSGTGSA
jgi:serine phosphatase RsbU (regulator of sigma subunit)